MIINVVAFSSNGCATAKRLGEVLAREQVRLFCRTSSDTHGLEPISGPVREWVRMSFEECDAIVFIGATGIAVRYIAPFIRSKDEDPAVVCMDELGRWAIALLSGHIGGCNELTRRIADGMGAEAIITTATDLNGRFSVDTFASKNHLRISSLRIAKDVSARVLDGRFVGFRTEIPIEGDLPKGVTVAETGDLGVCVSRNPTYKPFDTTLSLTPMDIVVGVGCKRGTDPGKLMDFVCDTLESLLVAPERVGTVASIDLKRDEAAVLELARSLGARVVFYSAEELNSLEGDFSESRFVRSVTDVDCVCERSAAKASGGNDFLLRKTARDGMTVAVCSREITPRFV